MNKQERNKLIELLIATIYFIVLVWNLINIITINNQKSYINNLEQKVNILTLDYEEFCIEDSLKQSDVYE